MKPKPGDRVVIVNSKSSFHQLAGEVIETCGGHAIFDVRVRFEEFERPVGFWWKELVLLHAVDRKPAFG